MKKLAAFFLIFFFFTVLFHVFNSNTYDAADGNFRCMEVFSSHELYIHGNNHMLYPLHIYYFNKLLERLGVVSKDGFEYFRHSTIMNEVSGALSLAVIYLILLMLTASELYSLAGVLCIGFSRSFIECAINPNEAMVGFFFSILAVWMFYLSVEKKKVLYGCIAGFLLSYASATYRSMVLVLFPILLVYLYRIFSNKEERTAYLKIAFAFIFAMIVSMIAIYSFCYKHFLHINNFADGFNRFVMPFTPGEDAKGIVGKVNPANFILIFYAFIQAIFTLPYFELRSLLLGGRGDYSIFFLLIPPILLVGILAVLLWYISVKLTKHDRACLGVFFVLSSSFIISLFMPFYVMMNHAKLWLQPITIFVALAIYTIVNYLRLNINKSINKYMKIYLSVFLIVMIAWNVCRILIPSHKGEEEVVAVAVAIDKVIPSDSLVLRDLNTLGKIFDSFFLGKRSIVSVPYLAMNLNENDIIDRIDKDIKEAKENNKEIYFIDLLNKTKYDWDLFIGRVAGVRYESFQKYRNRSKAIAKYVVKNDEYILYKYE